MVLTTEKDLCNGFHLFACPPPKEKKFKVTYTKDWIIDMKVPPISSQDLLIASDAVDGKSVSTPSTEKSGWPTYAKYSAIGSKL
jgi:hypothetical protein